MVGVRWLSWIGVVPAIACMLSCASVRATYAFSPKVQSLAASRLAIEGFARGLRSASRDLDARQIVSASARQEEPVLSAPLVHIPEQVYPVCNVPNSTFADTLQAWANTTFDTCLIKERELRQQCLLKDFLCCSELVATNVSDTLMRCDLSSGLCHVQDILRGRLLVRAWRARGCALEGNVGFLEDECQCLKAPATDDDFPYPGPCVILYPSSGLLDPATNLSTVATVPFGPYAVKNLTRTRPTAVTIPGEEPPLCVPVTPTKVRVCDAAAEARGRATMDTCVAWLNQPVPLDGSPGECCIQPILGTSSALWCAIGQGCVRIDGDFGAAVIDDFAAAPGCLNPLGSVLPPGGPRQDTCLCVPAEATTKGCATRSDMAPALNECMVVNSAAGGLIGETQFAPSLNVCAA